MRVNVFFFSRCIQITFVGQIPEKDFLKNDKNVTFHLALAMRVLAVVEYVSAKYVCIMLMVSYDGVSVMSIDKMG